jgi:hypothetical protein
LRVESLIPAYLEGVPTQVQRKNKTAPEDLIRPEVDTEERIARLVADYERRLREEFAKNPRTLHEIEMDVENLGNAVKESVTKAVVDLATPGYVGTRTMCSCGRKARFAGKRNRHILTLHGHLSFKRSYYHCRSCRSGLCPSDQILGIGSAECSRTVQAHIARVSSYLPSCQAAGELAASRDIVVSATTVQRYAKKTGVRIADAWDARRIQQMCGNLPAPETIPRRLFAAMDGVKIHVDGQWRDAKLGVVYQRGNDRRISHSCFYASLERSHQFGPRMRVLADSYGAGLCPDLQVLGDGAEWIWNETSKHFAHCVETLDCYHLKDHVWAVAHARFGQDSPQSKAWMELQHQRLHSDRPGEVIRDIASWLPRGKANQELRRTTTAYLNTHRHRILYKSLKEGGYDIGSGIIEAGCKTVVKSRLGGAGMRWSGAGASAILQLSAHRHSTGRTDYMAFTDAN